MAGRLDIWLWLLQRATAVLLAAFVLVHFVTILWAMGQELSAQAIVARLSGNILFLAFYGTFSVAAALHGAIGLRNILRETVPLGAIVDPLCLVFAAGLLWLGLRAAIGLYGLGV